MAEAARIGLAARGRTAPNPNVGCVIVADGKLIAQAATAPGGRPHAEAIALAEAGDAARGATLAFLVTTIILIIFTVDAKVNIAPPPRVIYVESYKADRTDAEIIADQKIASERLRKAKEAKKQQFRDLEKQLGM